MYEQVEKPKENKSRDVANSVTQKRSDGTQGFGFVDNRVKSVVQGRMQNSLSQTINQHKTICRTYNHTQIQTGTPLTAPIIQRVEWKDVKHNLIKIEAVTGGYEACYQGMKAGELDLEADDDGREWIYGVYTEKAYQGLGIGLSLLHQAVQDHEAVYAAVGLYDTDDNRHLSEEGAALVSSAVRNGILNKDWCFNPNFEPEQEDEDYDDYQD